MAKKNRFAARRRRLTRKFRRARIDALLVTKPQNIFYLSGFRGDDSALLVGRSRTVLITDSRYAEEAESVLSGVQLMVRRRGLMQTAAGAAVKADAPRLGVEAAMMTLGEHEELLRWARKTEIAPTRGLVEALRLRKDASEVAAIREAVRIAEAAFREVAAGLAPGQTEIEVARRLDGTMQDMGAEAPAFQTIVASGERSSLPHATPTTRRLRRGEPILFDWGARRRRYHSDLTRMVFWDRIPRFYKSVYSVVLEAQRRALARVKPGREAGKVDAAARAFLKAHRHGKHFGHGLGHGVGLEIHEGPTLAPSQDNPLRPGMVVTVEPGVYVPGSGGVRIEDLVLVTRTGRTTLTSLPKSQAAFVVQS